MSLMGATRRRLEMVVPEALEDRNYTTIREFEKLTNSKLETLTLFFRDNPQLEAKYLQNKRRNRALKYQLSIKAVNIRRRTGESVRKACKKEEITEPMYYQYSRELRRFGESA